MKKWYSTDQAGLKLKTSRAQVRRLIARHFRSLLGQIRQETGRGGGGWHWKITDKGIRYLQEVRKTRPRKSWWRKLLGI